MKINVLFENPESEGKILVKYGTLVSSGSFGPASKIGVELDNVNLEPGAFPTIVTVLEKTHPFSFFVRDVSSEYPVFIPEFGTAVLPEDDSRTYARVAADIAAKGLVSDFGRMENEPEETYENACRFNRDQSCAVWLGLGYDVRMFHVSPQECSQAGGHDFQYWGKIYFYNHTFPALEPATVPKTRYGILFEIGPGAHCRPHITKRLDSGVLPILHSVQDEQDIQYHVTMFATLENGPLKADAVKGTDAWAALSQTGHSSMSDEEKKQVADLLRKQTEESENQLICVVRVEAVNVSRMPAYAWFRAAHEGALGELRDGLMNSFFHKGKVCSVNRLNGNPLKELETALLIPPGEKAVFEMLVPHSPFTVERAEKLMKMNVEDHLEACRKYWLSKLNAAASIRIPETAIDERLKAGVLHLEINTLGRAESGPLLPCVGWYSPIGTESSPMIQYYDSVGLHDIARRCCDFFLERQQENGFIQNFFNYQSETGPALWSCGEHFLYTHDLSWLKKVTPKLIKACDYLLAWREKNKTEEFRKNGCYGLISGKVADPEDYFHSFFLNAGTYIGLKRMSEVLVHTAPEYAASLAKEMKLYAADIRRAVEYAQGRAPVKPLCDGSWTPTLPPWVEYSGDVSLYADGGGWFTHGSFASRSALCGALYLTIAELFDCSEEPVTFMLKANQHPVTRENAAISQPYYSRHDFAHLMRGEVKLFLKTYYNQLTALQDRQSYTFWEHYYMVSEHKTHEEAWFLMETRWMLYVENGERLDLFKAAPRLWFEPGKSISLENVKSHFGALTVKTSASENRIVCEFKLEGDSRTVNVRLPHPEGRHACSCSGGVYDPVTETVTVSGNSGSVTLEF